MSILSLRQLHIIGKQNHIVKDLSLDVQEGEWFALVGQSGSGKSMTAMAICQLLAPNLQAKGEIWYGEKNLLTLSSSEIRKVRGKRLAYIFQDYQGSFTPFLTIGQHFDEYQRTHLNLSKKARRQQAVNALISVGLNEDIYGRYPFQLSGGQLQRVSISIALLLEPDILIADEPTWPWTVYLPLRSYNCYQSSKKKPDVQSCSLPMIYVMSGSMRTALRS